MATEVFYNESGTSPPIQKKNASRQDNYKLGFTPWAQPLLASTDDYEEVCLGFKIGKNGVTYVGVSGRNVPTAGTALFQLGAQS